MSDLTQLSDEELLSQLSDDELKALAGEEAPKQESQSFDPGTALESYGQEMSYGYLPQMQAATEKGITSGLAALGVGPGAVDESLRQQGFQVPEQSLTDLKNENVRRIQAQSKQNPVSSAVGTGAGMAAQLAPLAKSVKALAGLGKAATATKGAAAVPLLAGPAVKSAKSLGDVSKAVLGAGATSALVNPEQAKESGEFIPTALGDRALNAAGGAFLAGTIQKLVPKTGISAAKKSSEKAVSSLGGTLTDVLKIKKKGKLGELGKTLVDEKIVTSLASPEEIKLRLDDRMNSLSDEVTDLIQAMEVKMNDPKFTEKFGKEAVNEVKNAAFIPQNISNKLKSEIQSKYNQLPEEMLQPALNTIDNWILNMPAAKKGYMTPAEVQQAKVQLNRFLKDSDFLKTDTTLAKEGLKAVRRSLMKGVENYAEAFSKVDKSKSGKDLRDLNRKFSNLIDASKLAEKGEARAIKNRSISLTDTIAGGSMAATAGAMTNDPTIAMIVAALGAGANKLGREYGDQASSVMYRNLSRLPELPPELTSTLSTQAVRRLRALSNE